MALRPRGTDLRHRMPLRQPMLHGKPTEALLEDMCVEPTVALLVRLMAVRRLALLLRCIPVIRPSPLAPVRRPMLPVLSHTPQTLPSRMNGTPLPARIGGAICALPTSIPCAVMDINRRARPRKDERRAAVTLSSASLRGFFFVGRNALSIERELIRAARTQTALPGWTRWSHVPAGRWMRRVRFES